MVRLLIACGTALATLLIPGLAAVTARKEDGDRSVARCLYQALVISFTVTTVAGLIMAWLQLFSLARLVAFDVVLALVLFAAGRRRGAPMALGPLDFHPAHGALLLVLAGTVVLHMPATEAVMGNADAGVYVMTGANIARAGGARVADPYWASLFPRFRTLFELHRFRRPEKFEGFFFDPERREVLFPQFFQVLPVWYAVAWALGGARGALHGNLLFALVATLAFYRLTRGFCGRGLAVAATALLVVNPAFIWFSRYPTGEMLMLALIVAGCDFELRGRELADPWRLAWGGCLLGLALLTKAFGLFLIVPILLRPAFDVDRRGGRRLPLEIAFHAPLLGAALLAAVQVLLTSPEYLRIHFTIGHVKRIAAAAPLVMVVAYLLFRRVARGRAALMRHGLALVALAGGLVGGIVRPLAVEVDNSNNLVELAGYVSPWCLALAFVGLVLALHRKPELPSHLFLVIAVSYTVIIGAGTGDIPFHIFSIRRFLPVTIPAVLLLTALVVESVGRTYPRRALAVMVLLATGGYELRAARPFLTTTEMAGFLAELGAVAAPIGPDDLVLVSGTSAARRLAAPLEMLHGKRRVVEMRGESFRAWDVLRQLVLAEQRAGSRVLWLTTEPRAASMDLVYRHEARLPTLEPRKEGLPRRMLESDATVSLFDFGDPLAVTKFEQPNIDVGSGRDLGVVTGFHERRTYRARDGKAWSYRWTSPHGYVRTLRRPSSVVLTMSGWRPRGVEAARVDLVWNGVKLATVHPGRLFEDFELQIPARLRAHTAGHDYGLLEIRSDGWSALDVSAETTDARTFGVMVSRVRFVVPDRARGRR